MAGSGVHVGQDRPGGVRGSGVGRYSAADFAWEFLRRNPAYLADWERLQVLGDEQGDSVDPRWGLQFAADPRRAAPNPAVYWRPEVAPGLVLSMQPAGADAARPWRRLNALGPGRRSEDGLRLNLRSGLQLLLGGAARPEGPLVVVLAFDKDYGLRVRAAQALNQGAAAPRTRLTDAQALRLRRALIALDGSLGEQSYRTIAERVFGAAAVAREPWKTASVRDVTIRLVRLGRGLMEGGYLKLLRGGP